MSDGGNRTITFWSVDKAGNIEEPKHKTFTADTSPPVTTISLNGTLHNGFYTSAVTVTLSATDQGGAGIQATNYQVNGGAAQTYVAPFTLSGDGNHTVSFWSVDNAGNTEAVQVKTVSIDQNAPTLTLAARALAKPRKSNDYPIEISGKVTDAASGVNHSGATYTVTAPGVATQQGRVPLAPDGTYLFQVQVAPASASQKTRTYTITVVAADNAANATSKTTTVTVGR